MPCHPGPGDAGDQGAYCGACARRRRGGARLGAGGRPARCQPFVCEPAAGGSDAPRRALEGALGGVARGDGRASVPGDGDLPAGVPVVRPLELQPLRRDPRGDRLLHQTRKPRAAGHGSAGGGDAPPGAAVRSGLRRWRAGGRRADTAVVPRLRSRRGQLARGDRVRAGLARHGRLPGKKSRQRARLDVLQLRRRRALAAAPTRPIYIEAGASDWEPAARTATACCVTSGVHKVRGSC